MRLRSAPLAIISALMIVSAWMSIRTADGSISDLTPGDVTVYADEAVDLSVGQDDSVTAKYAQLIGVCVVLSSVSTFEGPGATENQPALGFPLTTATIRFDRLLKGGAGDELTVDVTQEGAPGLTIEDLPEVAFMEVGQRYFLTARLKTDPSQGYFVYPLSVDPILITSQEQEDALVAHFEAMVNDEASPAAP